MKPSKVEAAQALLLRGNVFVHLDPRVGAVRVPVHLRRQAQVVLEIGVDMPLPIPDLVVDDNGILATLSFKGVGYTCAVPWRAVFALVGRDGRGYVWSEAMPKEVADALVAAGAREPAPVLRLDATRPRSGTPAPARPRGTRTERPSWLRVVK